MIKSIEFTGFRNLEDNSIEFNEKTNIFYGENAQGKTNFLELLYLFSGNQSFRGAKDNELISFGKDLFEGKIYFFTEDRDQTAKIKIFGKNNTFKKEIYINEVQKSSRAYLTEKIKVIIFSPDHLSVIKDGPSERRKFIDTAILCKKVKNAFLYSKYNKILMQRNALLKDIYKHKELKNTLSIWDENLIYYAGLITIERMKFVNELKEYAKEFHNGISENKEILDINYISSCGAEKEDTFEQINEKMLKSLKRNLERDIATGITNIGIHRDDIDILINDKKVKDFGSQGQQRSSIISLKLAEASVIEKNTGNKPVIMLDDVLSELDKKRQNFLINKLKDYQVFITCCDNLEENKFENVKLFNIKSGVIN